MDCENPAIVVVADQLLVRCLFRVFVTALLLHRNDSTVHHMQTILCGLLDIPRIQRRVDQLIFWSYDDDAVAA